MPNRLADETSPYLRQHRDNPVDWYPWGDEAFAEARRRDVPVLLSVGYSACHWCHVMAHESFEDETTAAVMNELFVNVKVDREERPDVDAVYMEAVQAHNGHGGWPMTVFLTPDQRPFFAGTYFPKKRHNQMPSFVELCHAVGNAWRDKRAEIEEQAGHLSDAVAARSAVELSPGPSGAAPPEILAATAEALTSHYDPEWGGFGRAPKFPQPSQIEALLRKNAVDGDEAALGMVTNTLDAMASGGIYDHLGGGFARYSVDAFWMVPHFEKMLYDQAGLARVYLHVWQLTGEPRFRQVLAETSGYVLRDLADPAGGFHSAEDADSEGEEGRFYVWRPEEIEAVLGADAGAAIEWYGVTKAGNFEGSNILHRPVRGDLLRPTPIEDARSRLLEARAGRVRPGRDDKVLTEWNAMFASVLAEAGAACGEAGWVAAAERAADFLHDHLRDGDGRWLRSWQADRGARHRAYAADVAWVVDMCTRLHEATGAARWMGRAVAAAEQLEESYADVEAGGFFTTAHDGERLIVRTKDLFDGATPSANSVAALALARLAALTGESRWRDLAEGVVGLLHQPLVGHPAAFTNLAAAADLLANGATEIVVAGDRPDLVAEVHRRFLPRAVLAWGERFESPLWEGRTDGQAYVCRSYVCQAPVDSPTALAALL